MFVILRGSVSVQLPEGKGFRTISRLGANDFFGEMSLLTGEPRTANVIADEATEVIQIRKSAIKPVFEANPEVLESVSAIVEERSSVLSQQILETSMHAQMTDAGLRTAIKRVFGLSEFD